MLLSWYDTVIGELYKILMFYIIILNHIILYYIIVALLYIFNVVSFLINNLLLIINSIGNLQYYTNNYLGGIKFK